MLIKRKIWSNFDAVFFKYLDYFSHNPKKFLMILLGRFLIIRKLVTLFTRKKQSHSSYLNRISPVFSQIDTDIAVESLQKNGYYLGLKLSTSIIQKILDFAYSEEIKIDSAPEIKFIYAEKSNAEKEYQQDIITGSYADPSSRCDALKQLEKDSKLLEIAAKYLGSNPIHVRTHLGWCFPANSENYQKLGKFGIPVTLFHCDLDDYRALKFFFYFTDVDKSSGAHVCIRGSHHKRSLKHYLFRSHGDRTMIDYYGIENLIYICGEAGFGFAEDPFCFHRGTPPIAKPRLMLQLEFALHDYGMWT